MEDIPYKAIPYAVLEESYVGFNDKRYVVLNENTLGYVMKASSQQLYILHASCLRGAPQRRGTIRISSDDTARLATIQDFEDYQVAVPLEYREDRKKTDVPQGVANWRADFRAEHRSLVQGPINLTVERMNEPRSA